MSSIDVDNDDEHDAMIMERNMFSMNLLRCSFPAFLSPFILMFYFCFTGMLRSYGKNDALIFEEKKSK